MGRKINDFAVVSLLMLLMASLAFWGCSGNNPAGDMNPSLRANANNEDAGSLGGGNDAVNDGDNDNNRPPDLPDIEGGKFADSVYAGHLQFDNSKSLQMDAAAAIVDQKGGGLSTEIDGKSIDFYFQPFSVSSETSINMVVEKGKNAWNEELYVFCFGPDGLAFNHYPILEMRVDPYFGDKPGLSYELYCWSGGTWLRYYSCGSNPRGIIKFFIPRLSTYALLIKNPNTGGNSFNN